MSKFVCFGNTVIRKEKRRVQKSIHLRTKIKNRLIEWMWKKGLSHKQVAALLKVLPHTVKNWELGVNLPREDLIPRILKLIRR